MHHGLSQPDILHRILEYLEVQPKDEFYAGYQQPLYDAPAISRLARTCRQFLEPCLDALWRTQHTLGPLMRTLPRDAYEDVMHTSVKLAIAPPRSYHLTFTRPLVKSDWVRFDYYASRVRALGYYYNEFADQEGGSWNLASAYFNREREVSEVILSHIRLYRPARWLLPNLNRLRWNIYDADYTPLLPLFLGPNLTSLALAFQPRYITGPRANPSAIQEQLALVLDSLATLCPSLQELEMYPEYASRVVVAARRFAFSCRKLEGYHVNTTKHGPSDRAFLMHLAAKPHLRKLYLDLDSEAAEYVPLLSSPPIYHPFPALQILWLKSYYLRSCTPLFEAMQHCRFFSLTVESETQPLASDVAQLLSTIRRHCATTTLHVFRLVQIELILEPEEDVWPPLKPDHLVDFAVLSPMLDFPNMRFFSLSLPVYGWLNDNDYRAIGAAWPGLVTFSFIEIWGSPTVTPATWEGVVSLVQQCPLLTELHILFDTRRNLDAVPRDIWVTSRLRFFDVINSPLPEDPTTFAQALFAIAPRILQVDVSDCGPWEQEENWDAPLTIDPHAYPGQVDTIMCRMRGEHFGTVYTEDVCGMKEMAETLEFQPQEWNPWA